MYKGIVARMEEFAEKAVDATPFQDAIVDTNAVEIDDVENQIDAASKEVDDVIEVSAALEAISNTFVESAKDGGFSKANINAINVSLQYLHKRIGFTPSANIAIESFGSVGTRAAATTFALEGFKESIAKAWDALIAGIKRIFEWIAEFYNKIFNSAKQMNERAKKIKEQLTKVTDHPKEKDQKFKNSYLFKALNIDGEVPVNIDAPLKNISTVLESCIKVAVKNAVEFKGVINQYYDLKTTKFSPSSLYNFELPAAAIQHLETVKNPEDYGYDPSSFKEGVLKVGMMPEMPGHKILIVAANNTTINGRAAFAVLDKIDMRITDIKNGKELKDDADLPVLTLDAAKAVINSVIDITDKLIRYESEKDKINVVKKEFSGAATKLKIIDFLMPTEDLKQIELHGYVRDLQILTKYFARSLDQPIASMCGYCLKTSKALIEYVKQSLKFYGTGTDLVVV